MSENLRIAGWRRLNGGKVPARIEYRYCPTDTNHWRVMGERCPVCKAEIAVLTYTPTMPAA